MRYLLLVLKGMAFGVSNIVPGLTGGARCDRPGRVH